VVPAWELQWKERAVQAPDTSRIAAWRRTASPDEQRLMNHLMRRRLRQFGYEQAPADRRTPPLPGRVNDEAHRALFALRSLLYHPPLHATLCRIERPLEKYGMHFKRL